MLPNYPKYNPACRNKQAESFADSASAQADKSRTAANSFMGGTAWQDESSRKEEHVTRTDTATQAPVCALIGLMRGGRLYFSAALEGNLELFNYSSGA